MRFMISKSVIYLLFAFLGICEKSIAQRIYKANSVLASGQWFKIAVKDPGVYKIDVPFLNGLGINI